MSDALSYAVVVPTLGRATLRALLAALVECAGPRPELLVLVDDRPEPHADNADLQSARRLCEAYAPVLVLAGGGRGPASARNIGWRAVARDVAWVAFLDDDVVPAHDWAQRLADDLGGVTDNVAGSQGRVVVPLPGDRRPTDAERVTAGLAHGRWITADMAYRREALDAVGGFDERFPRAYREDADLALRVETTVGRLVLGTRSVTHPARDVPWWHSVRVQAGNADDVLMARMHGPEWRERADVPPGRRPRHVVTVASAGAAIALLAVGRMRPASVAALTWAGLTAEFAWARIAPGPRTAREVARMLSTSVVIPFSATAHYAGGLRRWRASPPWQVPPAAVLFDRDGTLVHDVAYNGDPALVRLTPGAREAVQRVRRLGIPVGLVTNQSGIARGLLEPAQVDAVNARLAELVGGFDTVQICPHGEGEGCACRKPAPGMVHRAAAALGVPVERVAVVGDIGADVAAARAAGARGVLVPTATTRAEEISEAAALSQVAPDLAGAMDLLLGAGNPGPVTR